MADQPKGFEISEQMRTFTEKSVDQARKAFDDFMAATREAVGRMETGRSDAQEGAQDLNKKLLSLTEENVSSAFAHAQRLAKARDLQEVITLQAEFVKAQMATLGEQARVISDAASKTATTLVEKSADR